MRRSIFLVLYVVAKCQTVRTNDCEYDHNKFYSSTGDVNLVGLFDAHKDKNCTIPNSIVLQHMYHIAMTIKLLNDIDYMPGLKIGMSLYDICTMKEFDQTSLVATMANRNCSTPYSLGVFGTKYVSRMIQNVSAVFDVPVYTLNYAPESDVMMKISVALLRNLQYSNIDLAVFPSADLMQEFNSLTVAENICVKKSYTFTEYDGTCPGHELLIVIAITSAELSPLLKLEVDCVSTFIVIILDNTIDLTRITGPLDTKIPPLNCPIMVKNSFSKCSGPFAKLDIADFAAESLDLNVIIPCHAKTKHLVLHEAYIIIPSNIWPTFAISVEDDFQTVVSTIQENLRHSSNVTMDFIRVASTIVSVVDHLNHKIRNECGSGSSGALCANLTKLRKTDESRDESAFSVSEVLGIQKKNILQYLILKSDYNDMNSFGGIKIEENDVHIEFANPAFAKETIECEMSMENCRNCSNFLDLNETAFKMKCFPQTAAFTFKSNNWVSSVLTVCIIGIISCLCVLAFVTLRVCKQDILEGNPSSTFLLIVATILMYLAVFPFCIVSVDNRVLCVLKLFGASISYCFIFSVILSRVLMILTCDYNGSFMSHINGYLQSFLCFFMFAVQFGLVLEFWIFGWLLSNVDYCAKFNNNYFMAYLLYDAFLLIFIVSVVPFVTRSRRNYKEGLCFTVLTACFVVTWIGWTFSFFFVDYESKDFSVAFGLTATATSVVVCVLIPRTYLIVTGIVRDRVTSAIPSNISNMVDMNYRSTQALYDSVKLDMLKRGELNAGYYEDLHSSLEAVHDRKSVDVTVHSEEDNYENCSISHSDQKMTKF